MSLQFSYGKECVCYIFNPSFLHKFPIPSVQVCLSVLALNAGLRGVTLITKIVHAAKVVESCMSLYGDCDTTFKVQSYTITSTFKFPESSIPKMCNMCQ